MGLCDLFCWPGSKYKTKKTTPITASLTPQPPVTDNKTADDIKASGTTTSSDTNRALTADATAPTPATATAASMPGLRLITVRSLQSPRPPGRSIVNRYLHTLEELPSKPYNKNEYVGSYVGSYIAIDREQKLYFVVDEKELKEITIINFEKFKAERLKIINSKSTTTIYGDKHVELSNEDIQKLITANSRHVHNPVTSNNVDNTHADGVGIDSSVTTNNKTVASVMARPKINTTNEEIRSSFDAGSRADIMHAAAPTVTTTPHSTSTNPTGRGSPMHPSPQHSPPQSDRVPHKRADRLSGQSTASTATESPSASTGAINRTLTAVSDQLRAGALLNRTSLTLPSSSSTDSPTLTPTNSGATGSVTKQPLPPLKRVAGVKTDRSLFQNTQTRKESPGELRLFRASLPNMGMPSASAATPSATSSALATDQLTAVSPS